MEIARNWRLQRQRYALVGGVCERCGLKIFPARDRCPECHAPASTPFRFSGKGEVYSYSTIYQAPEGFEHFSPYVVALVRLAEGPLVAAQLTDVEGEPIEIGMPVEMVTRRLREDGKKGTIIYGYKFRPVIRPGASGGDGGAVAVPKRESAQTGK